ncbi:rubredoxin [Ferruginibacter lapsinanis]|uniref:rubredoxin n=1 Tax=Ferruginibacter lapsinanis TaxID=563172 RepID=UPI001E43C4E8|nr:rubredoxin [Ferruginibacter lapsinanis]UEG50104.1 rubredoxin [Ferruginibacter lapsinanis]
MLVKKSNIVKINLTGGIVSSGDMYAIMCAAESAQIKNVQFGVRQQLYCKVAEKFLYDFVETLQNIGMSFEVNEEHFPNIVSSYVTEDVFQNANWLSEGVYKDILDLFNYEPKLKININDNSQTFVPFFTGNINFISSYVSNYWYLYIRFPKTTHTYRWPVLIYTEDIPKISKSIETIIAANKMLFQDRDFINGNALYALVHDKDSYITQPATEELIIPDFGMPYYEGFNRYGNKSWLGIYKRDELFSVAFLKDVCSVCLKTKIGQLYTTPWKSIIINGIQQADRKLWDFVLNEHRINVRHASNELNWQVEDMCDEGLSLKKYLVRQFDKDDVRTFGLFFAIKTKPKTGLFGSVIIRKQQKPAAVKYKITDRFDILYSSNFNPNSKEYILFRSDVERENLETYLLSLCKYYYELKNEATDVNHDVFRKVVKPVETEPALKLIHQCPDCFTIYDEIYGDTVNDIAAGVTFAELSDAYECPTCGAAKEKFVPVAKPSLIES